MTRRGTRRFPRVRMALEESLPVEQRTIPQVSKPERLRQDFQRLCLPKISSSLCTPPLLKDGATASKRTRLRGLR